MESAKDKGDENMNIKKGYLNKKPIKEKKEKSFQKQIGIKYKKQSSSPQLWETSRKEHIKKGKTFFGIR